MLLRNLSQSQDVKSYIRAYWNKRPFDGAEPEKVVELFRDSGLSNISVQELVEVREAWRRNMPLLYRIARNYPIFLVKGIKGEKDRGDKNAVLWT